MQRKLLSIFFPIVSYGALRDKKSCVFLLLVVCCISAYFQIVLFWKSAFHVPLFWKQALVFSQQKEIRDKKCAFRPNLPSFSYFRVTFDSNQHRTWRYWGKCNDQNIRILICMNNSRSLCCKLNEYEIQRSLLLLFVKHF